MTGIEDDNAALHKYLNDTIGISDDVMEDLKEIYLVDASGNQYSSAA